MTKTEYAEYLDSDHWQERRKQAIAEAGAACERCAVPQWLAEMLYDQDLNVHHVNYRSRGAERAEDLEVLCRRCHELETFGRSDLKEVKVSRCAICGKKHWDRRADHCAYCARLLEEDAHVSSTKPEGVEESAVLTMDDPLICSHVAEAFAEVVREASNPVAVEVTSGLSRLDTLTFGMRPGEVTVVGARSGVGKSSLMIQAAVANASKGIPCHIFSLEMTKKQLDKRILSCVSGVPFRVIQKPQLMSSVDEDAIRRAMEEIMEWPLRVDDGAELTAAQIVWRSKMSIRHHGTRFIGVDYAQIVQGAGRDEKSRVAGVSRSLTSMIKHEDCSLMLLSQLRKMDQENYDRVPHVADLRETSQLESDAHVILLLHRGWDADNGCMSRDGQVLVAKNRAGETGTINVGFDRSLVVFTE